MGYRDPHNYITTFVARLPTWNLCHVEVSRVAIGASGAERLGTVYPVSQRPVTCAPTALLNACATLAATERALPMTALTGNDLL